MTLRLSPSVRARKRSASSAPARRSDVLVRPVAADGAAAERRRQAVEGRVGMSRTMTSWPARSYSLGRGRPRRGRSRRSRSSPCLLAGSARARPRRRTARSSGRTEWSGRSRSRHRTACDREARRRAGRRRARLASSTSAAPTSRACSRTGSSVTLDASATASAMSRTRWTSSERPAMSASSGSVQSISTTWTAISSALVRRRPDATSCTIRSSLGPPFRATTARLNAGASASGMAVTIPPRESSTVRRIASAAVGVRDRRPARPARVSLAPVRDVGDDRVLAPDQRRFEPLRGLVVEHPVPPAPGDVLGQDDDRERRLLVRRPGLVEDVEVGDDRRDQRPVRRLDDDERHAGELPLPALAQRVAPPRGRR